MISFAMFAGIVAGALSLIAYIPRALKTIRDGSHSRNIWLIWTLSNLLVLLSYYNLGARTTIWVPLAYFIGSATITVLTYKYKVDDWTTLHKWLLTIAILCGVRWLFFSNVSLDLSFNLLIYLISHVMIIKSKLKGRDKKTWIITWALYFAGSILNLLAVTDWSIALSIYPVVICVMNGLVFSITLRNHLYQERKRIVGWFESGEGL